jgi:hypothetical protein
MASDYGLNFGFRRSDESVRVSEGRFRTPTTGSALLIGTAVQIDPANPGYLIACAANAPLVPGAAGILVQEEIQVGSIYGADVSLLDSFSYGVAKPGRLSVISTGAGTKVWFKNSTAQARVDGRSISGVTICDLTGAGLGDTLGWDGTKWVKTTTATAAWMTITSISTATSYVEGVLLK